MSLTKAIAVLLGFIGSQVILSAPLLAQEDVLTSGGVQITVIDESGSPTANAPVYLLDSHHSLSVLQTDKNGSLILSLPEGSYTLSSAVMRPIADAMDRYISPQARIDVKAQDTLNLVLALHLADDAVANVSLPALKKMGLAQELAKYTN